MFAFAVWDRARPPLLLARDRFGEKPLFLLRERDSIAFASELASLEALAEQPLLEDEVATGLYFRFSYVPAPFAPAEGDEPARARHLSCASGLTWRKAAAVLFDPRGQHRARTLLRGRGRGVARAASRSACPIRLAAADVPGRDAARRADSTVPSSQCSPPAPTGAACAPTRSASPTIRPSTRAPTRAPSLRGSGSIEHRVVNARVDDLLAFTERVFDKLSEPLADASLIPTAYLLSQVEEKVVLGGDGADEVFAGYGVYPAMRLSASLPSPIKSLLRAIPAHGNPASLRQPQLRAAALFHANLGDSPAAEYLRWRTYASGPDLEQLGLDLSGEALVAEHLAVTGSGRLRDIQEADITFNLPNDMLRKVDIAAMMFGIEGRLPYLDSGLVAFALSLPESFLIKGGVRKRILRDAFAADLPPEILTPPQDGVPDADPRLVPRRAPARPPRSPRRRPEPFRPAHRPPAYRGACVGRRRTTRCCCGACSSS